MRWYHGENVFKLQSRKGKDLINDGLQQGLEVKVLLVRAHMVQDVLQQNVHLAQLAVKIPC